MIGDTMRGLKGRAVGLGVGPLEPADKIVTQFNGKVVSLTMMVLH